ncbi:MAG TPA: hypothetical protein VMA71_08750 [Alloacidobacterium sp.]|nr:hypothetical protein [Alloacidobacterium sp.]
MGLVKIDMNDPAYCTVADGGGQTTTAREAGVDVGGDQQPAAQCVASVLHSGGSSQFWLAF